MAELNGILVVNKPAGISSHGVVARVRRAAKTKRVGHTGTLDPDVSGVLPICIGSATRLAEYMLVQKKGYVGTVRFGYSTDTQDASGEVIERAPDDLQLKKRLTLDAIQETFRSFLGEQLQVPTPFSAIKVAGKRAYELARAGQEVTLAPRTVHFYEIEILEAQLEIENPEVTFRVICSKGTYIRTLCHDIGLHLGIPAHMAELTRIQSGPYTLADSYTLEQIEDLGESGRLHEILLPAASAIPFMPSLVLSDEEVAYTQNGRALTVEQSRVRQGSDLIQLLDAENKLCAIYQPETDDNKESSWIRLRPVKVFKE